MHQHLASAELSIPSLTLAPRLAHLVRYAVEATEGVSRSAQGVSDTSVSPEKRPLMTIGHALQTQIIKNMERELTRAFALVGTPFDSPADVQNFIESIARGVNAGLTSADSPLWRIWETNFGNTRADKIKGAVADFCTVFFDLWNNPGNAVTAAAWVEHRFNGEIHPLADGCGRTSIVLAASLLAHDNLGYPRFPSRAAYQHALNESFECFREIFALYIQR